jgi:serine/threonine-protein kinase
VATSIYAAVDLRSGCRVALKIQNADIVLDESTRARFKHEGYASNAVGHPGVVRVFEDGVTEDGRMFLVMELLDGADLSRLLRERMVLPVGEVAAIGVAVLDALVAAHARSVVHGDLKLANVFVTSTGDVKLLDFGRARVSEPGSGRAFTLNKAPTIDARSDIRALGAVLRALLTGRVEDTRPLRKIAPNVPDPIAAVIDKALAADHAATWEDSASMRSALSTASDLRPRTRPGPMRRPVAETSDVPPSVAQARPRAFETPTPRLRPGRTPSSPATAAGRTRMGAWPTWLLAAVSAIVCGGALLAALAVMHAARVDSSAQVAPTTAGRNVTTRIGGR